MLTQNISNQLLIFMNLYKDAKNQAFSPFFSGDIVDVKIEHSDWSGVSQEPDFS